MSRKETESRFNKLLQKNIPDEYYLSESNIKKSCLASIAHSLNDLYKCQSYTEEALSISCSDLPMNFDTSKLDLPTNLVSVIKQVFLICKLITVNIHIFDLQDSFLNNKNRQRHYLIIPAGIKLIDKNKIDYQAKETIHILHFNNQFHTILPKVEYNSECVFNYK